MLVIVGYIAIVAAVFGGFALAGGHLGSLVQPVELLMIGGAAQAGAFSALIDLLQARRDAPRVATGTSTPADGPMAD